MGLYRATVTGTYCGQTIATVLGFITVPPTTSADATTLAGRVATQFASDLMPNLVAGYILSKVDVVGMDVPTAFGTAATAAAGGVATPGAPAFCCINVQLRTALRGRSYQGRFGLTGLPKSAIDTVNENNIVAATVAGYQGSVNNFVSNMAGGALPATLAVVSTVSGGTPRPLPIGTPVTSTVVHFQIGSRVSRKG